MRLITVLIAFFVVGCQAGSKAMHTSKTTANFPDGTVIVQDTKTNGETILPTGVKEPSQIKVGSFGFDSLSSGVYESALSNVAEKSAWIFYGGSVLLIAAGVFFAAKRQEFLFGGILGVSGLILAGVPSVLAQLGTLVITLVIFAIIAGLFWLFGKQHVFKTLRTKHLPAITKLRKEGKDKEATAISRVISPDVDAQFDSLKNETK
ncbi:MAG: hypothetical protein ACRC78_18020 [Planktothrix sp.]